MTLFRKLFFTYLLVLVLGLVISAGFAGYQGWRNAGVNGAHVWESYGQQLADRLKDQDWTPENLKPVEDVIHVLQSGRGVRIWLVPRDQLEADPELAGVLQGNRTVLGIKPNSHFDGPVVAVPVYKGSEISGVVFVRPSLDNVRMARRTLLEVILYGSLIATGMVAAVSFSLSRRIARPIERIGDAARRIAQGDLSTRVEWESEDEIGRLAATFNEMADELNRLELARKELMANVSHELKGPLARVSGYLEAVHDGIGGEEARQRHLEIARREVGRLTRLVNDVLDYSRLEAGRLKLHPIPVDLAPHIIRAAEVFEAPAHTAGVTLSIHVPQNLPIVLSEPERTEQIVTNLLENALNHTPRDGRITLTASETEDSVQVQVEDTGTGIAPEDLERVWDRFYKQDPARTPDRRGFGLGLTIVRQLVELQGGQVFVRSELGKGSCFGFRLPKATPEEAGAS